MMRVSTLRLAYRRIAVLCDRASRYDFVLAIIPLAFLGAVALQELLDLSSTMAILLGSLVSALAVIDALFLNPPEGPSPNGPTA